MMSGRGKLLHVERDREGILEVYETATHRSLYFGSEHRQSSLSLHNEQMLELNYTRCMLTSLLLNQSPRRVLMIGLGGGSLARFLLTHFPDCHITALESRPAVVTLAQRFFKLPHIEPRLQIIIGDGVNYVEKAPTAFDLILVDAFDADGINPRVCTPAFFYHVHRILTEPGVLSMNLWTTKSHPYKTTLDAIRASFGRALLTLPLGRHGNMIALGLKGYALPIRFATLYTPAREFRSRTGIDFPGYLTTLQRRNTSLLDRLLGH